MKNSKSVAHITTVHHHSDTRITQRMCKSISDDSNFDCSIICFNANLINFVNLNKISLGPKLSRIKRLFILPKVLNIIVANKFDIIHLHDIELFFLIFFINNRKTKVVFDLHENYWVSILDKHYLPKPLREIIQNLVNIYLSICLKKANAIVTAWPKINEMIKVNSVTTINNYPTLKTAEFNKNLKGPVNFIFSGVLSFERGFKEALEFFQLFSKYNSSEIRVIGRFKSIKEEQYFIGKLKELDNISYYEWLPQQKLYENMQWANFGFIYFHDIKNHRHSIPNKLFEYMQNGAIPLCSNLPFLSEFILKNNSGFSLNIFDHNENIQNIQTLLLSPTAYTRILTNIQSTSQKFVWDNEFDKLRELYNNI
jgi:glycosyltransferase involved in cell wall biosynthesis